ncbi:MAG: hypothetical protein H7844_07585 [Nitrospirae bacterium YQR-1]
MDNKDKNVTHRPVSDKKGTGYKPILGCYAIDPESPTTLQVYDEIISAKAQVGFLLDTFICGVELSEDGAVGITYILDNISDTLINCCNALDKIRGVQTTA